MSVPKTRASIRRLVLPSGVVEVLRQLPGDSGLPVDVPSPVKEDMPMTPGAVRRRLQIILERAGCKKIRFHDLRHTFATLSLESGMDVKTLSAMLGHVSAATTLDIYTHVTGDMQSEAAAKIDRGLGNEVREESAQSEQSAAEDFRPVQRKTRKPGAGCISQINDHLFEGALLPHLAGRRKALQMRLRPHPGGVRSKAEGADPADERGAASPCGTRHGASPRRTSSPRHRRRSGCT